VSSTSTSRPTPPQRPRRPHLDPDRAEDGTVAPAPASVQVQTVCSGCGAVVAAPDLHALFHDQLAALRAEVDTLTTAVDVDGTLADAPEWAT
jgi:hypothetical protein